MAKAEPEFPDINFGFYLTQWLMSVGPVQSGGMSLSAIPHTELKAWADNIGIQFEGLEAEWLHKMSDAYASEVSRSSGENTTAPFVYSE